MLFELNDEEQQLKDQARELLQNRCSHKSLREVFEGPEPFDKDLWREIVALGWAATAIPEAYGGLGLRPNALCVLAEELGRSLASLPFASSIILAAEALVHAGTEAQKNKYLPSLAAGTTLATLAISEGAGLTGADSPRAIYRDGKLSGVKQPVPDGLTADLAMVTCQMQSGAGARGVGLVIVDLHQPGVRRKLIETIDPGRSHATLEFENAVAEPLGAIGDWEIAQKVFDRAAVYTAFEQIGGAQACLDMSCAYANSRYAFGQPIGSFQAVKHRLVDVFIKLTLARANAELAAVALANNSVELPRAAASARLAASDAYLCAARDNILTHGGVGFTWEFDCHLYLRRARLLSLSLGRTGAWEDRLVDQLDRQNFSSAVSEVLE